MERQFKVGNWLVDPAENTLSNQFQTINIEPKAMALLCMLCEAEGKVVSREDIMLKLWNDRYVTDYALNNLISSLRKYLNSETTKESYIKTRPKKGYQILAEIVEVEDTKPLLGEHQDNEVTTSSENKANKKRPFYILAACISIVLMLFVLLFSSDQEQVVPVKPSIAVLPFDIYDNQEELNFFAYGLADEIIHQLNTVDHFRVISRRTSFTYKDKTINIKDIAKELDVVFILEGSVREEKDTIRATVQLVNTVDESIQWSRVFTASRQNSFGIQHEISTDIAKSMDASFTAFPEERMRYKPVSNEAYLHVLRGRKLNQAGNAEANLKARDEFLMATLLDPNYAMAYIDLSVSYLLLQQRKMLDYDEASSLFLEAINKALAIDPDLPEAHAAYGIYYYNLYNFEQSKLSFEKALNGNPKLYLALVNYANLLRAFYYPEQARELYYRALDLAPLSGIIHWGIAQTSESLGKFEEAISSYQNCVNRNPQSTNCLFGLAYSYRLNTQHDAADATFNKLEALVPTSDYQYNMALAWHALQSGQSQKANDLLEPLIAQHGFGIPLQTITYAKVGLNQHGSWLTRLSEVPDPMSRGLAFKANYAAAAYFSGNCELAIEYYEEMLKEQPNLAIDADILANGVTYIANLAYCYQKLSKPLQADLKLKQLEEIISKLPKAQNDHPAFMFVNAQYALLSGDSQNAKSDIERIKNSNWGVKWLLERDPIFNLFSDSL